MVGDLRIPHFVGLNALQLVPPARILIEVMSRRVVVLGDVTVRYQLVAIGAVGYVALLGVLTWQALRGHSIAQPRAARR